MFYGAGTRRLTTVDMDTTHATFVEFVMSSATQTGTTCIPPRSGDYLILSYSVDGGMTFNFLSVF